jgi:hypothetical protein
MQNLSIASIINKNQVASDTPWLVAVKVEVINPETKAIVTTLRLVANDEDITLAGQDFVKSNFSVDITENENELPSVTLSIVDITQTAQGYMQAYQGGIGSHVTLYFFPAPSTVVENAEISYDFDVVSASASSSSYSITWALGAENPLTLSVPARKQTRDRCGWQFKDEYCGYVGPKTVCDLSYASDDGCFGRNNQDRFGGFPAIQIRNL